MTAILIVDDERPFLESVARVLRIEGYGDVTQVSDPRQVEPLVEGKVFDVAFLDITMPAVDGLELLERIKEISPETECIMLTANDSVPSVVKAMRLGAYDYILKPLSPDQLTQSLDRALERKRLVGSLMIRSSKTMPRSLRNPGAFSGIVTSSEAMIRLLHEAELHASSGIPVLITGETGVGKELMARAIHGASRRTDGPFVAVNMLALPPTLFESEFFGHSKGAFTGADRDRTGYLGLARGGTLFLDEIGDLQLETQGKLLRILQEGEYTPVGKSRSELADARFIAATNQDLEKLVADGRFRRDLYYRLQFAKIEIPPLRHREADIQLLADHFLESSSGAGRKLSDEARAVLAGHDWPGNVRELRGVIEAASNLAEKGTIGPEHMRLPSRGVGVRTGESIGAAMPAAECGIEPLADVEKRHIVAAYDALGRNKTRTARMLGIGLQTLHRKLRSYGEK